ncbi:MAG: peptide deformylase [Flavobacteriaceae bacterium]|nr:peptide deformylase [Flavobacteriaceae bacterium]
MILPIIAYGDSILRNVSKEIDRMFPNLDEFIANMYETMYATNGVGIAAPQLGIPARLFVIDSREMYNKDGIEGQGLKQIFINPEIINETGQNWEYEEGCLSIPGIRENVRRRPTIKVRFTNENWEDQTTEFDGYTARVIQHENDHLDGVLFIDKISPLKKQLIRGKLMEIQRGWVKVDYRMRFAR